jgi:5-methylcytosine-specific restriction endonuclease McrA
MNRLHPWVCACGYKIAADAQCPCQQRQARRRKADHDAKRPTASARGYDSQWSIERAAYLKTHPVCVTCNQPATVVDHIIPHRGDMQLFWTRENWQPLCTSCHSRTKQAQERRQFRKR